MLGNMKCQEARGLGDRLHALLVSGRPGRTLSRSGHSCLGLTMGHVGGAVPRRAHPCVQPKGQDSCACECFDCCVASFWSTGVLSQSPHFRSYSNLVTSLMPRKGGASPFSQGHPFPVPSNPHFLASKVVS